MVEVWVVEFSPRQFGAYTVLRNCIRIAPNRHVGVDCAAFLEFVSPPRCSNMAKGALFVLKYLLFVEGEAAHVRNDGGDAVVNRGLRWMFFINGNRIACCHWPMFYERLEFRPIIVHC